MPGRQSLRLLVGGLVALTALIGPPALLSAQSASGNVARGASLPSQPSDTIVRLALDSTSGRGVPFVALLDEAVYRVELDGRSRLELRQVVQLFDANAARSAAERALTYHGGTQTLTVKWVRVLRPNGQVVSDSVAQAQDAEVPVSMSNPIYTGQRVRRLSLAGVSAGVIVDMAYVIEQRTPPRAGDFLARWTLGHAVPVRRTQFTVDAPSGMPLQVVERNLVRPRAQRDSAGRQVLHWSATDQQPLRAEPFAADSNGVVASIMVGPSGDWAPVASWYDGLARPRYALSADIRRRADSVLTAARARTPLDTVRALHRWVAQDVRYVSISLGLGGYEPRTPDEVLRTGVGDCKDKATLFIALLRHVKLEADPVLLHNVARPTATLPSVMQFNHVIAAVRLDGQWRYADLTAELLPFGELPTSYQGHFALRVGARGEAVPITLPMAPVEQLGSSTRLVVQVDTAGQAVGQGEEAARGPLGMAMRATMTSAPDSTRRAALARSMAQRLGGGALGDVVVDSLDLFGGRDLRADARITYALQYSRAWRQVGASRVLQLPQSMRGPARQFAAGAQSLAAMPPRQLPIDAGRLLPTGVTSFEWRVTLPAGWTAEPPPAVRATSFFGAYESQWTVVGNELRLVRTMTGQRGVFPPERLAEVLVWMRAVGQDDIEFVTLIPSR